MVELETKESFEQFRTTLLESNLIDVDSEDKISFPNRDKYLDFGFGIFLLWILIHKRKSIPRLYFTNLISERTLFLVSPCEDTPYFVRPRGYKRGTLYIDKIDDCFYTYPKNCQFCELRNALLFNIGYFKNTNAFRNYLTDKYLDQIKGDFPKIKDCQDCKPRYIEWVRNKIIENEQNGILLGGYPALLNVNSEVFKLLFLEPIDVDLHKATISFFDSFLVLLLAEKFQSKKYGSNAKIKHPFISYKIDVVILLENELLVIETTSYHHSLKSLKNKLLNYNALSGLSDKYFYIYLTLTQEPYTLISKKKPPLKITQSDEEVGTLSSIMQGDCFEYLTMPDTYKDLDGNLNADWWDIKYLRNLFNYILGKIDDITNRLKI